MLRTLTTLLTLAAVASMLAITATAVADEALDGAFAALAEYDWGADRGALKPIDDAVADANDDADAQKMLETKLVAVVQGDGSRAAKDYACRKLSLIGTAECVPALAELLPDEKLSHMGRYALERIPADEAVVAMRDALPETEGLQKIGVINSLGVRRDAKSTEALVALLGSDDKQIAAAAAAALGEIGTPAAAKALGQFQKDAPEALEIAAADAYLVCAERLLADGNKLQAMQIYRALSGSDIKHVKLAAMRGMLAAAKK
jgi:HEAT repeat protein